MSRLEADHLAQDISKTWIESQEIPSLLILVQEVVKVWPHHITCYWHVGDCEE